MSKLEELIKQLCPNGVKYKRLDEVFESFNGMTQGYLINGKKMEIVSLLNI